MPSKNPTPIDLAAVLTALPNGLDELLYIRLPDGSEVWKTPRLLWTKSETAVLLGVHVNTLGNWMKAGDIEDASPDGHTRFRFEDVLRCRRARGRSDD